MPTTSATPPPATPLPAVVAPSEDAARQAKIDRHRIKTRAGLLKWLGQQDEGQASMADMHDYTERRFFVAHRGFSDLMEQLTDQGLIDFDPEGGLCTITDAGRAWNA
ncbi:MAG: hypothetical protein GXP62_04580 [Oligoflexia bacterium]|nr:hypothetical protein [Oligoflexia bacterium]